MNREIKYRCFDKQWKTMSKVNMFLFFANELDHDGNDGEPKGMDHFEVMQFTGLKDNNGVEIYEGDILEIDSNNKAVVKYRGAAFCYGYTKGVLKDLHKTMSHYTAKNTTVIGNIYQNPELIAA